MSAIDIFHEDKSRHENYYADEVNWRSYVTQQQTPVVGPISHTTPAPGTPTPLLTDGDPNEVTPLMNLPPNSIATGTPMAYGPGIADNQIVSASDPDPTLGMLTIVGIGVAVLIGVVLLTR